jgi:hypothetical protein
MESPTLPSACRTSSPACSIACPCCPACRVGGRTNFFHCSTCNCCYSISLRDSHVCVTNSMHQNCPVCFEYLFDSIRPISVLPCGHTIHQVSSHTCLQSHPACPAGERDGLMLKSTQWGSAAALCCVAFWVDNVCNQLIGRTGLWWSCHALLPQPTLCVCGRAASCVVGCGAA